ncbi:MAG: transposase [Deltaproteobacteria bacterium]|nr:transposase [Deltaproteobacteria bacterium]
MAVTKDSILSRDSVSVGSIISREAGCGAISFRQRAGDSLNLNPHLHVVVPDRVFTRCTDPAGGSPERAVFHQLPKPTDADVLAVTRRVVSRTRCLLRRAGLDQPEPAFDAMDALALSVLRDGASHRGPRDEPRDFHRSRLSAFVCSLEVGQSRSAA